MGTESEWFVLYSRQFVRDAKRLYTLVQLSIKGITTLTQMPRFGEAMLTIQRAQGMGDELEGLAEVKAEAELAQLEVDEGFPLTLSQYMVDLWALMESYVRGLVALSIQHDQAKLQGNAISGLKVKLGEYEQLDREERARYIVQLLERDVASPLKSGVDRFESLLSCVGLGGPVPSGLSRALFELSQIRNCVVHNARKADARLVMACPHLGFSLGEPLAFEFEYVWRIRKAVADYFVLLIARVSESNGEPIEEIAQEVENDWSLENVRSVQQ